MFIEIGSDAEKAYFLEFCFGVVFAVDVVVVVIDIITVMHIHLVKDHITVASPRINDSRL